MIKRILLAAVALVAFSAVISRAAPDVITDHNGITIGTTADDKLTFYGGTRVVQPSGASQAAVATTLATPVTLTVSKGAASTLTLSTASITYAGVDGSTNTLSIVTNVTITAAAPVTNVAVNAVAGYTTTNQANSIVTLGNAIRAGLTNLNLLKGGP